MPTPKVPVPKGADVAATNYNKYYQKNQVAYGNQVRWVDDPNRSDPSKGKFMRLADWEAMQEDKRKHPGAYSGNTPSAPAAGPAAVPAPVAGSTPTTVNFLGSTPVAPGGVDVAGVTRVAPGGDNSALLMRNGLAPAPDLYGNKKGVPLPTMDTSIPSNAPLNTGAPNWWISQAYANPNEQQAFANAANAILPSLSPEDQRTLATYLATNFKDVYGSYANPNNQFAPIPTSTEGLRNQYLNPQRVQNTLAILDKMRAATPGANLGAGFDYLTNALQLMTKYSTPGSPMTREQYNQFSAAIKALNASTGSDISAYKNLASMFNLPSFTAGPLVSNDQNKRFNQ